jgi:hypothetical protein
MGPQVTPKWILLVGLLVLAAAGVCPPRAAETTAGTLTRERFICDDLNDAAFLQSPGLAPKVGLTSLPFLPRVTCLTASS